MGRRITRIGTGIMGGVVAVLPVTPALAQDGPIVGTPPFEDAIPAWGETYTDPVFWESNVTEILNSMHFSMPWPFDAVKPEAFLPTVPVANGEYVSALPESPIDLSAITYEWEGTTRTVADFLNATYSDSISIAIDGNLVYEDYANGYSPEVRHQPWSVTKTFIGALIGIALDEGLIASLQDPIESYIPDLAGTAWQGATIENILQMESGVHWDEGTPVLVINTQVEQWVQAALDYYSEGNVGQTRNEFLASLPKDYEQGTRFSYNSGNTQVLAWLMELAWGMPFNEIVAEKLWQPMGAAGDAMMLADREGSVIASQGLYARPHDFARFGELLRNDGVTPEGHRVIPAGWVDQMVTMTEVSEGAYGYQTWAHPIAGQGAWSASGFQGQKITVVPDACLVGVRLSHALGVDVNESNDFQDPNAYAFSTPTFETHWQAMLRAIADEVGTCASSTPALTPGPPPAPAVEDPGAAPADETAVAGADVTLPTTGGGLAGLGLLALATGGRLSRRRGPLSRPRGPRTRG